LNTTILDIQWTRLKITKTSLGTINDKSGKVAFEASYIEEGNEEVLKEHSRFKKLNGQWFYYDGKG